MVNKQGSTTTTLPTQYRSSYKKGKKKKNVSIDNEEIRRCPNCNRTKMLVKPRYTKDGKDYKYSHCKNCDYANYIPLTKE
jgi:ssDNA-binding Zn-finger/Zn-ribbon topoisomerase 1